MPSLGPASTVCISVRFLLHCLQCLTLPSMLPVQDLAAHETLSQVSVMINSTPKFAWNLQVLFITPEKLGASGKLQSTLDALHRRGELARVVIDEARMSRAVPRSQPLRSTRLGQSSAWGL